MPRRAHKPSPVRFDALRRMALALPAARPRAFVTDHYAGYPMLLVRLPRVRPALLRERVEKTWRRHAGKRAPAARAPARKRA